MECAQELVAGNNPDTLLHNQKSEILCCRQWLQKMGTKAGSIRLHICVQRGKGLKNCEFSLSY